MEIVQSYIEDIIRSFSTTDPFIDAEAEDVNDIYLSAIDQTTPGWADEEEDVYEREDEEGEEGDDEVDSDDQLTILKVFQIERRVVVLGNPGIGKTTAIKHLALNLALSYKNGDGNDIPVFIALKDIRKDSSLYEKFEYFLQDSKLLEAYRNGDILLIVDGLNELPRELYAGTMMDLRRILNGSPGMGLVATSRKYGYNNQLHIPQYEIKDFTTNDIKDYLQKISGSEDLYRRMSKRRGIGQLLKNPLLLNMVAKVWKEKNRIPTSKASLYESYLSYQFRKAYKGTFYEGKEEQILEVMSRIAYEMRKTGFLSDSVETFGELVEEYVPEGEGAWMTDAILKSGILTMDVVTMDFHYITFIHETFQEYLSSLRIAEEMVRTGHFPIDVTQNEWLETLVLVMQIIHGKKDDTLLLKGLNSLYEDFLKQSEDTTVMYYLPRIVTVCKDLALDSDLCDSWLQQLLLFYMDRYIHLPEEERTELRFSTLVHSVFHLHKTPLHRLFWKDIRWMKEWLYTEEEIENEGMALTSISAKGGILLGAFPKCNFKVEICLCLLELQDDMKEIDCLSHRLKYALRASCVQMRPDDYKVLYEHGQKEVLFMTRDPRFIQDQLEKGEQMNIKKSIQMLSVRNMECAEYFFGKFFPETITDVEVHERLLRKKIYWLDIPMVQRIVFNDERYEPFMPIVLRYCQSLPDNMLTDHYWNYVNPRKKGIIHQTEAKQQGTVRPQYILSDNEGKFYHVYNYTASDDMPEPDQNTIDRCIERAVENTTVVKMYVYIFTILPEVIENERYKFVPMLNASFEGKGKGYRIIGNQLILMAKKKQKGITGEHDLRLVLSDGMHLAHLESQNQLKLLKSDSMLQDSIILKEEDFVPESVVLPENFPYYRLDEIYSQCHDYLSTLKLSKADDYNMTGFLPHLLFRESNQAPTFLLVEYFAEGEVKTYDIFKNKTCRIERQHLGIWTKPGDVLVKRGRKSFFVLQSQEDLERYGFVKGIVTTGKRVKKTIKDFSNKRYTYIDSSLEYNYGDVVWFIPDLRREESPRALRVMRVETQDPESDNDILTD